jgi:hypothetical protein
MKEGYTHIAVVLDKSGSMDKIKDDTIGGFNTFLKGQQETAQPGDTFSFVQFSGSSRNSGYGSYYRTDEGPIYKFLYKNADIKTVKELTGKTFVPGGGTPLLDTLGDIIKDTGTFLASLKEEERPSKVIFVIITDGEENTSARFSKAQVKELITEHTGIWKWEFVFIGANQDAIAEAGNYGILMTNSMSYATNKAGVDETYKSLTRSLNTFKAAPVGMNYAASGAAFTAEERVASFGGEALDANTAKIVMSATATIVTPTP